MDAEEKSATENGKFQKKKKFDFFQKEKTENFAEVEIENDEDEDDGKWTSHGDYMAVKKRKLLAQFSDAAKKISKNCENSKIFSGISVHVNGLTNPSADEIKRLMMLHGGEFHLYYSSKKTSHIVASNLPFTKIVQLKIKKPVVKPAWISESIRLKKLLPWRNFELYPMAIQEKSSLNKETKIDSKNGQRPLGGPEIPPQNFLLFESIAGPSTSGINPSAIQGNARSSVEIEKNSRKPAEENSADIENPQLSNALKNSHDVMKGCHDTAKKMDAEFPVALKAGDPNYLNQFYARSRLHHLSLWKVEAKQLVERLKEENEGTFPGRQRIREFLGRNRNLETNKISSTVVMHVDFDCFFVSVGLLSRPHLAGKPVACCHGRSGLGQLTKNDGQEKIRKNENQENDFNSRSEIASCNYIARKAGLKNGMYLGPAKQLCPDLVTVPYEFEEYKRISTIFYETVASYTLNIEAVSCDEMIVDCTEVLEETGASPDEFASFLRQEIFTKSGGCHVSAGLAGNPLLARLATKKAKPNGQIYVAAEEVSSFLVQIPIADLPGVGRSALQKFQKLNSSTCFDLQKISLEKMQSVFGQKIGLKFFNYGRGIDDHAVQNQNLRKSVSADINYGMRMTKSEEFKTFFSELSQEIENRLRTANVLGHTITLKLLVRHPDAPVEPPKFMGHGRCNSHNKSITLTQPTNSSEIVAREGLLLFRNLGIDVKEIRGIGIQITNLIPSKKWKMEKSGKGLNPVNNLNLMNNLNVRSEPFREVNVPVAPKEIVPFNSAVLESSYEQPDNGVDDLDDSASSFSSSPVKLTDAPKYCEKNYPPPSLASYYNLVDEVGWLRVYQKLAIDLRNWLDPKNSKKSNPKNSVAPLQLFVSHSTIPENFSGNSNLPFLLENLRRSASEISSSNEKTFSFEKKSNFDESVKAELEFSSLTSTPSAGLDAVSKAVFANMLQETECKFWMNHFDVAEDFSMTEFPSTFHGATLNYLDSPLVSRENDLGGKSTTPKVTWAIWKLNAMFGDEWFSVVMDENRTVKDAQQAQLELNSVSATQAVRQQNRRLKIRGGLEFSPVFQNQTKIQTKLQQKLKNPQPVAPSMHMPLLSPSKLDPDFLAALPTDLLDEIFDMYKNAGYGQMKKSATFGLAKIDLENRSSKNKAKIDLPVRKQRAKADRNLKKLANQPSIDSFMKLMKSTRSSQEAKQTSATTVETITLDSDGEIFPEENFPSVSPQKKRKTQEETPPAKTTSVKRKKDFLFSEKPEEFFENFANFLKKNSPNEDFQNAILRWCRAQLETKKLSEVDKFLKFFYREVDFLSSVIRKSLWMKAYRSITEEVERKVEEQFGNALVVRKFFF